MKYLIMVALIYILAAMSCKAYFQTLVKTTKMSEDRVLRKFAELVVLGRILEAWTSASLESFIGWSQLFLCCTGWLAINCYGIMPAVVVVGGGASFVIGLLVSVYCLQMTADSRALSWELIEEKRRRFWTGNRHSTVYYYKAKWAAQQPFPFSCGEYFSISTSAIMVYLDVLLNNLVSAVLGYKP